METSTQAISWTQAQAQEQADEQHWESTLHWTKWYWDRAQRDTGREKEVHEPQPALVYFLPLLISMNNNEVTRGGGVAGKAGDRTSESLRRVYAII